MNVYPSMLFLPIAAYVIGSIPFGLILGKLSTGADIRLTGSGNIGATNVMRLAGIRWGAATLLLDGAKGAVMASIAVTLSGGAVSWLTAVTILFTVCGHMFPIYLKGKPSGKGIATAAGCLAATVPLALTVSLLVFIGSVAWSKKVSVGSLTATLAMPPAVWFASQHVPMTAAGIVLMVLIIERHRGNIQRLANGVEPPVGPMPRSGK